MVADGLEEVLAGLPALGEDSDLPIEVGLVHVPADAVEAGHHTPTTRRDPCVKVALGLRYLSDDLDRVVRHADLRVEERRFAGDLESSVRLDDRGRAILDHVAHVAVSPEQESTSRRIVLGLLEEEDPGPRLVRHLAHVTLHLGGLDDRRRLGDGEVVARAADEDEEEGDAEDRVEDRFHGIAPFGLRCQHIRICQRETTIEPHSCIVVSH